MAGLAPTGTTPLFCIDLARSPSWFDCGEPISGSYKASGLPYDEIDRIFISHLHADHVAGFLMLMQGFWLERRKRNCRCICRLTASSPWARCSRRDGFEELLQFRLRFAALRAGRPVMAGNVRVTPHRSTASGNGCGRFFKRNTR